MITACGQPSAVTFENDTTLMKVFTVTCPTFQVTTPRRLGRYTRFLQLGNQHSDASGQNFFLGPPLSPPTPLHGPRAV